MIIIGIVLSFVGLVYLCWLLFALAVQALPFFAGVTVGFAAYHSGSGPVAAMIVGAIAGSVALVLGQVAFTRLRPSCALRSRFSLPYRPPWPGIMPGAGSHRSSYLWVPGETSLQLRARPPSRPTATMRMWLSPPRAGRCCRSDIASSASVADLRRANLPSLKCAYAGRSL